MSRRFRDGALAVRIFCFTHKLSRPDEDMRRVLVLFLIIPASMHAELPVVPQFLGLWTCTRPGSPVTTELTILPGGKMEVQTGIYSGPARWVYQAPKFSYSLGVKTINMVVTSYASDQFSAYSEATPNIVDQCTRKDPTVCLEGDGVNGPITTFDIKSLILANGTLNNGKLQGKMQVTKFSPDGQPTMLIQTNAERGQMEGPASVTLFARGNRVEMSGSYTHGKFGGECQAHGFASEKPAFTFVGQCESFDMTVGKWTLRDQNVAEITLIVGQCQQSRSCTATLRMPDGTTDSGMSGGADFQGSRFSCKFDPTTFRYGCESRK